MNIYSSQKKIKEKHFLLALHSSYENFGVAVLDLKDPTLKIKTSTFNTGRKLSNYLFSCINQVLPTRNWFQIARIAVATGPGGFTGTRLSIAMARTIAQQLECQLDGVSSFELIANRLSKSLNSSQLNNPFWITNFLNRRGLVGGKYIIKCSSISTDLKAIELEAPKLLPKGMEVSPALKAEENVSLDIIELLKICLSSHQEQKTSHWKDILPIYPTSPVENIK